MSEGEAIDHIDLPAGDFRSPRRYLGPGVFALHEEDRERVNLPPPWDLISEDDWANVMDLPTDVALQSTSYEGSLISDLAALQSNWIFSSPNPGEAPFMDEVVLLAGEEFDALVFNAVHGWYRQAIGCLRNAVETLIVSASLAVTANRRSFDDWRAGTKTFGFGTARGLLRDSQVGRKVDADAAPESVFGDDATSWTKSCYSRLCAYAHSQAGYNNADFWESNGPVFVPSALLVVEAEFRETIALCYLLLRLGWPTYRPGRGQQVLLGGPLGRFAKYEGLLRGWLLQGC